MFVIALSHKGRGWRAGMINGAAPCMPGSGAAGGGGGPPPDPPTPVPAWQTTSPGHRPERGPGSRRAGQGHLPGGVVLLGHPNLGGRRGAEKKKLRSTEGIMKVVLILFGWEKRHLVNSPASIPKRLARYLLGGRRCGGGGLCWGSAAPPRGLFPGSIPAELGRGGCAGPPGAERRPPGERPGGGERSAGTRWQLRGGQDEYGPSRQGGGGGRNEARFPHLVVFYRFLLTAAKRRRAHYREGSAAKKTQTWAAKGGLYPSPFSFPLLYKDSQRSKD